jgi:hypothetical protein
MTTTYAVASTMGAASIPHATATIIDPTASLTITPVLHPRDGVPDPRSRTFWSAVANVLYIRRQHGTDLFGPTPDLTAKLAQGNDLIAFGRRGPIGCDIDALAGLALWDAADRAAQVDRPSAPVAHHVIGWLPTGAARECWRDLTLEFLDRAVVANGMVAEWCIHALADEGGRWIKRPHLHVILTHRFWRPGTRVGQPNAAWLGTPRHRQRMVEAWDGVMGMPAAVD